MKTIANFIRKNYFIIVIALIYFVSDIFLTEANPVGFNSYLHKNDIEKTQNLHPEENWEKVFYGSSVVAVSYIEGGSDFINFGITYGTICDLYELLTKGYIKVTNEIVLGLNDISFYDKLTTDPTYVNHKRFYEHYFYFNRDKINPFLKESFTKILNNQEIVPEYGNQIKQVYYGSSSDEELEESNKRMLENFSFPLGDCDKNFRDLQRLIDYCENNNLRLRALWMPENPKILPTPTALKVKERVNEILSAGNIETLDWVKKYDAEYFYDIGHLNYEKGAPLFTSEINEWLDAK